MKTGTLIAYFIKRDEARKAFWILLRRGYRRAALIIRHADGGVRIWDPFPWRRSFWAALAFILFGALAAVASLSLQWQGLFPGGPGSALLLILAGGFIGILFSLTWVRRSRFGVERELLEDHARWLDAGETVLILQAPIETLAIPMAVLQKSGEIPPMIFVLHPKRESRARGDWSPGTPLNPAQLQEHARRLATDHRVDPKPLRNIRLLKRLERGREWIQQVCLDLSEASRLEQSVSPTTEWLLDNEYILESNCPRRSAEPAPAFLPAAAGACRANPTGDCRASTVWRENLPLTPTCAWIRRTSWPLLRPINPLSSYRLANSGPSPRCCAPC